MRDGKEAYEKEFQFSVQQWAEICGLIPRTYAGVEAWNRITSIISWQETDYTYLITFPREEADEIVRVLTAYRPSLGYCEPVIPEHWR